MLEAPGVRCKEAPDFSSAIGQLCFTPSMLSRIAMLLVMTALSLAPTASAAAKKEDKLSITFHIETDATDNPKMIFPQLTNGQTRYFRRLPEVSLKDIATFSPFPSDVEEQYGVVFKLKDGTINRLYGVTGANQGRWIIAQINGTVIDGVMIDQAINDGVVVIWKGVTLADIAQLDDALKRAGESAKKKK
jgi:hypothetical protein